MGLFDDVWAGNLTKTALKKYVADSVDIDELHPTKGISPLAAAVLRGHVSVVEHLLEDGADVNKPTKIGQSPLSLAASLTKVNRAEIVRLLLKHKAEVDGTCTYIDNNTPLMLAISESRDVEVIAQLVTAGASFTAVNSKGQTVEDIAKKKNSPAINHALRPKAAQDATVATIVNLIVSVVSLILAWVNNSIVNGVVRGVVKELHGISGEIDRQVAEKIYDEEPKTSAEFKQAINDYVKGSGLGDFFADDNPFLQTVAEKAVELSEDPNDPLARAQNLPNLITVNLYQSVIYCDDSGSMQIDKRDVAQARLVERIARVTTRLVPDGDGVELRFINTNRSDLSKLDAAAVKARMDSLNILNSNFTEIGTNLEAKILKPLVYDVLQRGEKLQRPFLISIITDGCPGGPPHGGRETRDTFKNAILTCGNVLASKNYPRTAVLFQISQIGNDKNAKKFLDDLKNEPRIEDVLYVTSDQLDAEYKKLRDNDRHLEEYLLNTILSPITRRNIGT